MHAGSHLVQNSDMADHVVHSRVFFLARRKGPRMCDLQMVALQMVASYAPNIRKMLLIDHVPFY